MIRAAVANAKEAIRQSGKQAWIGLDMGPTGKLLRPMGDLAFEDCYAIYREVVEIGADAGADFVLIETMSDSYELKDAVLAAREAGFRQSRKFFSPASGSASENRLS